jgi:hypothetical protein
MEGLVKRISSLLFQVGLAPKTLLLYLSDTSPVCVRGLPDTFEVGSMATQPVMPEMKDEPPEPEAASSERVALPSPP